MQDFLAQINQNTIKQRNYKLKTFIQKQKALIVEKIQLNKLSLVDLLKKKQNKKVTSQSSLNNDHSEYKYSDIKSQNLRQSSDFNKIQKIAVFSSNFSLQDLQHCFSMFQCACNNILNTYFPLLMEDEFLTLQSQLQFFCYFREIQNKIYFINKTVEKSIQLTTEQILKLSSFNPQSIKSDQNVSDLLKNNEQSFNIRQSDEISNKNTLKLKKICRKKITQKGKNSKIPHQLTLPLQKWLLQNFNDPYPSSQDKKKIAKESGLTTSQVNNWFINARQRVIKKYLRKSENVQVQNEDFSFHNEQKVQKSRKITKNKGLL